MRTISLSSWRLCSRAAQLIAIVSLVQASGPAAAAPDDLTAASLAPSGGLLELLQPTGEAAIGEDRVLASVEHDGHRMTFVEHTAIGTVGVYEASPLTATPYLQVMRSQDPQSESHSALELYLAISRREAPAALVADHDRHRSTPAQALVLPPANGPESPNGSCEFDDAIQFGSVWALNWHNGIGQQHDLHAQLSFFDDINGSTGLLFDANDSSARWLAACNGSYVFGLSSIYLRPAMFVGGQWVKLSPHGVEPFTQVVYWSFGGPEHWGLHMSEGIGVNVLSTRNWAIGGAIDAPFGLTGG